MTLFFIAHFFSSQMSKQNSGCRNFCQKLQFLQIVDLIFAPISDKKKRKDLIIGIYGDRESGYKGVTPKRVKELTLVCEKDILEWLNKNNNPQSNLNERQCQMNHQNLLSLNLTTHFLALGIHILHF